MIPTPASAPSPPAAPAGCGWTSPRTTPSRRDATMTAAMRSRAPSLAAVALVISTGCSGTLPPSEWVTDIPRGECVVTLEHGDATGRWSLEHHHAADGRVLSGTNRLRYHGRAWERFDYDDAGRLSGIHFYEEVGEEDFPCAAEGGCYVPPLRTVVHVRLEHDAAGRLTRRTDDDRTYERAGQEYRTRVSARRDVRYDYDDAGRLSRIRSGEGDTRLVYEGGALRRLIRDARYPRRTDVEVDRAGRITATSLHTCTPERDCRLTRRVTYRYDDAGLLVEALAFDPTGEDAGERREWTYDGSRVVRAARVELSATEEERSRHVLEYAYDDRGRLTVVMENGNPRARFRYEGACDRLPEPTGPSALADLGARACVRSPGYVLDECTVR